MSRRLLLVDDEDAIRTIACISLERIAGWTVIPVASGQAALQAAENDGPFDAVLLDVMMPGLDGPTTYQHLRDGPLPSEVPVIFLTAKIATADREHLSSLGATGVIAKPFDPMTLPDQIQRLLD